MSSPSTLAARTLDRASAALRDGSSASLPEIVKLLGALSADSVEVSVFEMAELIQQDPTILAKVISVANTLYYNPTCTPVSTVTQAVHVIGYSRIRTLSMSLMLAEHASRSRNPEEQREAAAMALTAGCIAQSVAEGRMMIDPEQAFVCASLRNFGRIVLTTYMADDYREAKALANDGHDDEAFRSIFGLTPMELGRELLKSANLPDSLLSAIRDIPPDKLAILEKTPESQMMAIADFSARFATITLNGNLSADEFAAQSKALADNYVSVLPNLAEVVQTVMEETEQALNVFVQQFGLKVLPGNSLQRIRQRVKHIDPPAAVARMAAVRAAEEAAQKAIADPEGAAADRVAAEALAAAAPSAAASGFLSGSGGKPPLAVTPKPQHPGLPGAAAEASPLAQGRSNGTSSPLTTASTAKIEKSAWTSGAERIAGLVRDPGATRESVLSAALETVQRCLEAPECLVLSQYNSGTMAPDFRLMVGHGNLYDTLKHRARARADERTVIGVCLTRRENILIHQANEPKIVPYLPEWMKDSTHFRAFAILPIVNQKHIHGVIIAAWREARQIVISAEQAQLLRTLLAAVGGVCERQKH